MSMLVDVREPRLMSDTIRHFHHGRYSPHVCVVSDSLDEGCVENLQEVSPLPNRELQGCLKNSPYCELHVVECKLVDGVVWLGGTVSSYFLKQMAQETVKSLRAGRGIANNIKVCYAPTRCSPHKCK